MSGRATERQLNSLDINREPGMQALTIAISPAGVQYFVQQLVVERLLNALSALKPPDKTVSVPPITLIGRSVHQEWYNISITLSGGSLPNFHPVFGGMTQAGSLFTITLSASDLTVDYSWNEQCDRSVSFQPPVHVNNTWDYTTSIQSLVVSVPITLAQQADSYSFTVGNVTATPTGLNPNIPGDSIVHPSCFGPTVNDATTQALESIDFQSPIQNLLQNVFGTIPASGRLTPDIVFGFNQGDSALAFPDGQGLTLGVTGDVTCKGEAYPGGTPPSLAVPDIPTASQVRFFASDYQFNELFWAFSADGLLSMTIRAGDLPDPGMLNTSYYQNSSLSPLYQKYPGLPMTVDVTPLAAPTVSFQPSYDLTFGDNGVLTTLESALPEGTYSQLRALDESVYLTKAACEAALQQALGPDYAQYGAQIEQASVVAGPFPQTYQVTQAGLNSLQSQLAPGTYQKLSAALTVGQAFADRSWLLIAVENATGPVDPAGKDAQAIENAFAAGPCQQIYWVTEGTNGALATLADSLPADVYNDIAGLKHVVYPDVASFQAELQNVIGPAAGNYLTQIEKAAAVSGAIVTHHVQAVFNVIKAGTTIPVFTANISETDVQQNFRLGQAGSSQTVQSDFQLISAGTKATLVTSNIPCIDASGFPDIWNFTLQPVYITEAQKMAHTGVPLPFMAGLRFLFNQATVRVQPGYADVQANVQFSAPAGFFDAMSAAPAVVDTAGLAQRFAVQPAQPVQPAVAGRAPGAGPAAMGAANGPPTLHRTKTAAAQTRLAPPRERHRAPATRPRTRRAGEEMPETETFDFHFTLGHLPGIEQFHLHTGSERIPLRPHTAQTLAAHAARNRALGLLDDEARSMFTHYAEGVSLSPRVARILRVVYASATAPIPELALMTVHVPRWARSAHRQQALRRDTNGVPVSLASLGVTTPQPFAHALAASIDADQLVTTASTAATLVFHHPQLATSDPATAAVVMDDHINSPDNLANIQRFQGQISRQGPAWQASVPSVDAKGDQLTWGPGFARAGQPVYRNKLSDATVAGAGPAMQLPLTTSQQDAALQNSSWSVNQGIGAVPHLAPSAARELRAGRAPAKMALAAATGGYAFTIDNLTPGHGLSIDDASLDFEPAPGGGGTLSINVSNDYLRSLYAFVQFLDDHGGVVLVDNLKYVPIDVVTPVLVILGIPLPTEPTALSFDWPAGAASARLLHGGFGTSRWDNDVVWPGAILTAVFNWAIPGLFLIAGALLESSAWFKALEEENSLVTKLVNICMGVFGAEEASQPPDAGTFLVAAMDAIAGILVHEGAEALQALIIEKLAESAFEDAIPMVDLFFQIFNRAVDLAEIAETTVEVLTSPAVYEVGIVRTLDLQAAISPDPTDGIWPQTAATWETIVQYQGGTAHTQSGSMLGTGTSSSQPVTVTFHALPAGGSLQVKFNVYSATGFLCGQYTSAWQPAVLPGHQQVLTVTGAIQENLVPLTRDTVYQYKQKLVFDAASSAHTWQPGQFTLDTSQAASLDQGQISAAVAAAFGQNACRLGGGATVDVIDPGKAWTITDGTAAYAVAVEQQAMPDGPVEVLLVSTRNIPLEVVTDLDADDTGHHLAKLVNITMNDKAHMLGYCWRASGQDIPETGGKFDLPGQIHAFQNISVLADPQSSLQFSPSGFVNQPALVYDQFGPAPLFQVDRAFSGELDQGGQVAADLADRFRAFGYPLPEGAVVTVVTAGAAWTIGLPGTPAYSLARVTDIIEVHPYPTETISQRNYYVQPTSDSPSYEYQLRHVTFGGDNGFDMAQDQSWGRFTLPFNDDFVVHPQGYVVAISYDQSRMMVVQLPAEAAPDDQAPTAVIVSGPAGPSGRQGLLNGPKSLSVTADGRILVLEQGLSPAGGRIQAFDVNGNPVPSFDAGTVTTVPASYAGDLDAGLASADLRQAFAAAGAPLSGVWLVQDQTSLYQLSEHEGAVVVTSGGADLSLNWTITSKGGTYQLSRNGTDISVSQDGKLLFTMPASLAASLNQDITTGGVQQAFSQHGITLTPPISVTGDALTLDQSVITDLIEGRVPASLPAALTVRDLPLAAAAKVSASVVVTVRDPGKLWTVADQRASSSYKLSLDPGAGELSIVDFVSTVPLYDQRPGADVTYLSMGTELKGYIYVLSYTGDGSSPADYRLDVYQPNGPWLARTTGVNAAKIVVDMWRNLYTLNYESFPGPDGRTEPSVSTWIPSI
jgi:LBP / BPI / CETP family, C-terminal domain